MVDIKVFSDNNKLEEAYEKLLEALNKVSKEYQLSYFELYGIIEAIKSDLYNQVGEEE